MSQKQPGKNAGQISVRTTVLRGPIPLTADQRRWARFLRFEVGLDWPDVVTATGRTERDIRHSLANARTPHVKPKRVAINVGPTAGDRLRAMQLPGEAMWQTVNRLLNI